MLKTYQLTESEIDEFAHVFANYTYASSETGMVALYPGYPDSTRLINYLKVIIRLANDCHSIYATSDKHEGILILTDTTNPYPTSVVLKMMIGMVRALGFRGFKEVMNKFQAGGASIERKYRADKKDFIQVELLAIKENDQNQGYMRPLMESAIELAQSKNLPLILTTDAIDKRDKYMHLGMSFGSYTNH